MQLMKICENCRFYIEITEKYKSGECRFNPPIVIPTGVTAHTAPGPICTTVWPSVSSAERACGKWVQR